MIHLSPGGRSPCLNNTHVRLRGGAAQAPFLSYKSPSADSDTDSQHGRHKHQHVLEMSQACPGLTSGFYSSELNHIYDGS